MDLAARVRQFTQKSVFSALETCFSLKTGVPLAAMELYKRNHLKQWDVLLLKLLP